MTPLPSDPSQSKSEIARAARYAENLAVALHAKHYSDNTQWKPLSGDIIGLLTQIDNMTVGLQSPAAVVKEIRSDRVHMGVKVWDFVYGQKRGNVTAEDLSDFIEANFKGSRAVIDHPLTPQIGRMVKTMLGRD